MPRLHNLIAKLHQLLDATAPLADATEQAGQAIAQRLNAGGKLLACGNGGSAAEAAHLTTELVCRFVDDRPPYPAICLNTHGGDFTAICNDYTFEEVFARQVHAFGKPDDVLVVYSTSGNSENIRRALEAAKACNVLSIALLGRDGGNCLDIADIDLLVPGEETARIQEVHMLLTHALCETIEMHLKIEKN